MAESSARAVSELLRADSGGGDIVVEHSRLERRAPCAERLDDSLRLRLHDKMDVCWTMRPEADIDLRGIRETPHHAARAVKYRSHLRTFVGRQVRNPHDVTQRLDHKRPNAERADAVLNTPVVGLVDHTTWEIATSVR
jgi:hypothetical protein